MSYAVDMLKSSNWMPVVKKVIGRRLLPWAALEDASAENDRTISQDLLASALEPDGSFAERHSIAVRVRRPGYWHKFPYQITIRLDRPSGAQTEFEKIMGLGYADRMFYGHLSERGGLSSWVWLDLDAMRRNAKENWPLFYAPDRKWSGVCRNSDGIGFFFLDTRALMPEVILGAGGYWAPRPSNQTVV